MNFSDLIKQAMIFSAPKIEIGNKPSKKQEEKIEPQTKQEALPSNPEFWQNRQGVEVLGKNKKEESLILNEFNKAFINTSDKFTIKQAELFLNSEDLESILKLINEHNFSKKAVLELFKTPKYSEEKENSWENLSKTIKYLTNCKDETIKYYSKSLEAIYDNKDSTGEKLLSKTREKNGLVNLGRLNFIIKLSDTSTPFVREKLFDIYSLVKEDEVEFVYDNLESVFKTPVCVAKNLTPAYEFCFKRDEHSNLVLKDENIEYLKELSENINNISLNLDFYNLIENPVNKETFRELANLGIGNLDINPLIKIIKTYNNPENQKEIDGFCKDKLYEYAETKMPLKTFPAIYEACFEKGEFKEDLFEKLLKINSYSPNFIETAQENNLFADLVEEKVEVKDLSFKTRIKLFNSLINIREILANTNSPENDSTLKLMSNIFREVELSLLDSDSILDVDDISRKDFIVNVLKSNNADGSGELNEFETTIKDSIPLLKEMKQGVNLKYSRKDFLKDLSTLAGSEEEIKNISKKLQISPVFNSENQLEGYDGIINLKNLNRNNELENKVYDLCYKFIYENEITTESKDLNKALNIVIKGIPEFINTIGKKQNSTHSYPLDVHILLVLANSINNPDYKNLSTIDKTMLKFTALIHDISKHENTPDEGHQNQSAILAKGISKRFFKNPFTQDRIYDLVKNHHWLEKLNTSYNQDKNEVISKIAYRFRQPNDYDIAKVLARSDLQGVSDKFYENHKSALEAEDIVSIDNELDWFYSTGCAIFSDSIIAKSKLENHKQKLNGVEYKVIDFNKIDDEEDMGKYGFTQGKKKKDLYLLVHMLNENNATAGNLEALKSLSSSINNGVLSQSLITPKYKKTYADSCGVLLSNINTNIITMADSNQTSGFEKNFSDIIKLLHSGKNYRTFFKEQFYKRANIDENSLTELEFANFYRKNIAKKTSLSQFQDKKEYKINDRIKLTGHELKEILKQIQDSMIDKKQLDWNEIVGYVPKINAVISKAESLDKVPKPALDFANENDLPVILI